MEPKTPVWLNNVIAPHILSIPSYVPGKPIEELQRELGISQAVKLASNENPLGPSPLAMKAIEDHLVRSHVYPESSAPDLRSALAEHVGVSADSIVLGNGSDEIMQMAAHVMIRPGDEAIMGANTFSMYRIVSEAFGGKAIQIPLASHRLDLKAMAAAVTERTRLIFLAVPNSPTGTIVTRAELDEFVRILPTDQSLLVVDEAYREFVDDSDCPWGSDYIHGRIPVLVLRTFSKIYGLAGLRVGYGFGAPWLIDLLNRVRPPFNVNSLAQTAALAALADADHLERSLNLTREGIRYLTEELRALGLTVIPSHANFVTFCLENDAGPVYQALLKQGIIVRHLASFGMPNCIRVSVGKPDDNRRFTTALKMVLRELTSMYDTIPIG